MDPIEVTSMHRPDPTWAHTDAAGHVHGFYPPGDYRPQLSYTLPTLKQVVDVEGVYDEEGDMLEPPIWHWACVECDETIRPRYVADEYRQYIAGLKHYAVDGETVPFDEFKRLAIEAGAPWAEGMRP
jgi:hypothetical protein